MSDEPKPPFNPNAQPTVPLDEFCIDASRTRTQVELLAAFAYTERQAGRHHDTPGAYAERFGKFHREPTE